MGRSWNVTSENVTKNGFNLNSDSKGSGKRTLFQKSVFQADYMTFVVVAPLSLDYELPS